MQQKHSSATMINIKRPFFHTGLQSCRDGSANRWPNLFRWNGRNSTHSMRGKLAIVIFWYIRYYPPAKQSLLCIKLLVDIFSNSRWEQASQGSDDFGIWSRVFEARNLNTWMQIRSVYDANCPHRSLEKLGYPIPRILEKSQKNATFLPSSRYTEHSFGFLPKLPHLPNRQKSVSIPLGVLQLQPKARILFVFSPKTRRHFQMEILKHFGIASFDVFCFNSTQLDLYLTP